MLDFPILSCIIFTPLVASFIIYLAPLFVPEINKDTFAKQVALLTSLFVLFLSLALWFFFDPNFHDMQFVEQRQWVTGYNIYYVLGIDGVSLMFILLTAILMPVCVISSWNNVKTRMQEYMLSFLVMETMIMGVFCAQDILLFYIFFEAVLIPMYLIIGIWGGANRIYAAYKFFLYTLAGSLFLLISILYLYYATGTTNISELQAIAPELSLTVQRMLWLGMFASFAVKVPMWPVHTWLPDAHVQAPTAGSVILAGVLLKLGGYGFFRLSLPLLPDASLYYADFVFYLSIIAVVYTSFVALMQDDMKKLIAYSSVAHMGFVTAGLFSFNVQGIEGAIFQMISHGLVSGALFLCVGVVYDRMHTKEIAFYNGLTKKMPKFAFHFMIFMLASVGLPATSGFVGEFLVLLGVFQFSKLYSVLMATAMVLGAAYMLWLFARVMFNKTVNPKLKDISDLNRIEKISFWPISIMVIILGVYPNIILNSIHTPTKLVEDALLTKDEISAASVTSSNVSIQKYKDGLEGI